MLLQTHPLTESEARIVCSWRYPAPYDAYNLPPWEESARQGLGITQRPVREGEFFAACQSNAFIGWFRLKSSADSIVLGVGLAPECCGKGFGVQLLRLAIEKCAELYGSLPLRLEVRAFNRRAIRCYERVGFRELSRVQKHTPSGRAEFLLMEYHPNHSFFPPGGDPTCIESQPSS